MSKEAYYFSHDAGARRDPKIVQMMSVYGFEGYGWYWAIIEMMREEAGHKLDWTGKYFFQGLASELSTDAERMLTFVDDCVEEFKLFKKDADYVWSDSLLKRMGKYQKLIEQRREAGKMSAQKRKNNKDKSTVVERALKPDSTGAQQLKERKLKETKGKKEKEGGFLLEFPLDWQTNEAFRKAWAEWEQHRKEIKKKLTPLSVTKIVNDLKVRPIEEVVRMIENAIAKGWQGIYEISEAQARTGYDPTGGWGG